MNCYVTTAIDYPNALPHIGTAFEKIGADAYVRFRRFQGHNVKFLIGNDENTLKVIKVANKLGLPFDEYVDGMASDFKTVWNKLDISYDDFIQTSSLRHKEGVQRFLRVFDNSSYIEKRKYKALYCEECEEFKTPKNIINDKCPNHLNSSLVEREEENYFFLLSKFKQKILDFLKDAKIEPENRRNEMINFVENDLQDISISRKNDGWGIPIPWDESQVVYVWFDALLSYWTSIEEDQLLSGGLWWPADCHFIGKDITRFHCALLPAMFMARCDITGTAFTGLGKIFAHGFINQNKEKLSKSGNAISPTALIEQYGVDAYRYYFLAKCNFAGDSEFSEDHFKEVYNTELADGLGNLVSRVHGMFNRYFNGSIQYTDYCDLKSRTEILQYKTDIENCNFKGAIDYIRTVASNCDKYIDVMKPWELVKTEEGKTKCLLVIYDLIMELRIISLLLKPFLPSTAEKIYNSFQWEDQWENLNWDYLVKLSEDKCYNALSVNAKSEKFQPIFPKIL